MNSAPSKTRSGFGQAIGVIFWIFVIAFGALMAFAAGKFFWPGAGRATVELGVRFLLCGVLFVLVGIWRFVAAIRNARNRKRPAQR
jgi:cytochrome b561